METKVCASCKQTLIVSEFEFKNKEKSRRSSWCKKCTREYKKKHYLVRKDQYVAAARIRNNQRRSGLRKLIFAYLKTHPCVDCDEPDIVVLEFDHRDPKLKSATVAGLVRMFASEDLLVAEMQKCDVRCANCHRRRTAKQFNWYASLNEQVISQPRRKKRNPKENTMSALVSHVHKSRFGFHPCDRETFLKLKELNKLYVDALHRKAAWERWERKEPHNRIARQRLRDSQGKVVGYGIPVPLDEPELNGLLRKETYRSDTKRNGTLNIVKGKIVPVERAGVRLIEGAELIAQEYKYARTPQPSEKGVRQLKLSVEAIDRLLQAAK